MLFGIAIILCAAVCNNTGLIVEQRALGSLPEIDVRRPVRMVRILAGRPLWLCGFTLLLCGLMLQVAGLSKLPLTVAQPIFAVGLALVILVAAVVLREPLGRNEYLGLLVIVGSFVMLALSLDPHTDKVGTKANPVVLAAVAAGAAVVSLAVFSSAGRRSRRRQPGVIYGVSVGLMNGVGGLSAKAGSTLLTEHGAAGARSLISTPYPYMFAVAAVLMLGMTQMALQRCRAAVFIPAQVVVGNTYVVVVGTVVFGEHLPDTPIRLMLRITGLVAAVLVLVVMQGGSTSRHRGQRRRGAVWAAVPPSEGRRRRQASRSTAS